MFMNTKILRFLAKGKSVDYIAKTLGADKKYIRTVRREGAQKIQVERNHDPKVVKAEKEYIKKVEALYKKPDLKKVEALYKKPDLVNHPPHYKAGGIEVIDFIEAKDLNFRLANVVKYVSRAGKKATDPVQDLEKAAWYLKREIDARKGA